MNGSEPLRVLGIGDYGDLGDLYADLHRRGHTVRMAIADPAYRDVYSGLIEQSDDWRQELEWIRAAGKNGIIIFETAHDGKCQDELRRRGFQVIGGCEFGDRLEGDRAFGQAIMQSIGLHIAPTRQFTAVADGIAYIRARPRRYVLKHNGHHHPSTRTHVGCFTDGQDIIALLEQFGQASESVDFVLMDAIDGIETGVGAYFNGRQFVGPICLDWEHKRFFPGDMGELTGEMGTVVTYRGGERLFADTLALLAPQLAEHGYCGYINLNTIINDEGVWPLEFTCRFGYPGFAVLAPLHTDGWESVLRAMCGQACKVETLAGYSVGVVVTVPPFPYATTPPPSRGMPIRFHGGLSDADRQHIHFGEVNFTSGKPVVGGTSGYVLVVTGCGSEVAAAQRAVYALVARTIIPNARYRPDIGNRFTEHDANILARLGYLSQSTPLSSPPLSPLLSTPSLSLSSLANVLQ